MLKVIQRNKEDHRANPVPRTPDATMVAFAGGGHLRNNKWRHLVKAALDHASEESTWTRHDFTLASANTWVEKRIAYNSLLLDDAYISASTYSPANTGIYMMTPGIVLSTSHFNTCDFVTYHSGSFGMNPLLGATPAGMLDFDLSPEISDPLYGYDRYAVENWDGYNADAISTETLSAARELYRSLPSTFGVPDIAPGNDGTIGFEWVMQDGPLRKLFIDIGPDRIWSGYWRRSDDTKQSIKPEPINAGTEQALKVLFDKLNA